MVIDAAPCQASSFITFCLEKKYSPSAVLSASSKLDIRPGDLEVSQRRCQCQRRWLNIGQTLDKHWVDVISPGDIKASPPMFVKCWVTINDAGPTFVKH